MTEREDPVQALIRRTQIIDYVSGAQWKTIQARFRGAMLDAWLEAFEAIVAADGPAAAPLFVRSTLAAAKSFGGDTGLVFAQCAVRVHKAAGRNAAHAMLSQAPRATFHLKEASAFEVWCEALAELAVPAPQCVELVTARCDALLSQLDATGFHRWIVAGIVASGGDPVQQEAYFSLSDASALRVLEQEASDVHLGLLDRRLKAYMTALWGVHPVIRPLLPTKSPHAARRVTFENHLVRMPEAFAGFRAGQAERLFRAAAAHVGAHMAFTRRRFEAKSLKPIQIALVSLIEDARVETLAGESYPGLLRLWREFHVAQPEGPNIASALMARLSRALIDPDYKDANPWVDKGRHMVFDKREEWDDPAVIRRIGVMLGNDLGQMRVQFNARTHVVQPPYRDDNIGLWDFGDPPQDAPDQADMLIESVRMTPDDTDSDERDKEEEDGDDANSERARALPLDPDAGIPVAHYGEWDHRLGRERPEWTTIMEYQPRPGRPEIIDGLLEGYPETVNRITSLIRQVRVSRPTRLKRQPEGERLDLEASIRATIERRAGISPDTRVYETSARLHRDLSVLLLLDISESTKDQIRGSATSVYSIERAATALLAHAMAEVGDPFAVHAFSSDGRKDVRYVRIKDFGEPYGKAGKARLAGLRPGYSTRMGAALRHAGASIARQLTHRRLVMLVTDGEPSDIDVQDRKYLVEDARRAVQELAHLGIDVICVGLDGGGDAYLTRIFGRRNAVQIDNVGSLPEKLPMLYFRLTA